MSEPINIETKICLDGDAIAGAVAKHIRKNPSNDQVSSLAAKRAAFFHKFIPEDAAKDSSVELSSSDRLKRAGEALVALGREIMDGRVVLSDTKGSK